MRAFPAIFAVITGLAVLPACADEANPDPSARQHPVSEGGTLSVTFENDLFAGQDRNYTNGAQLSYVTGRNHLPWLGRVARRNLGWLTNADDWYASYAIGQNIYTPQDLSRVPPDPRDRPYAGFTYFSFGVIADRGDRLDTLAVEIGVVGPASQADDAQRIVHKLRGFHEPRGWDFQLKNEPGIRLLYERKYRFGTKFDLGLFDLQADAAPQFNVALGNVETYASAGVTVRLGRHLQDSYGPPRVRPALAGPGFFGGGGFNWYVFAGADGRLVARNIFLQGNTFRDSRSVDAFPFVGDFQAGLAVQFRNVQLAYTQVFRTPEFHGQDGFSDFGSLTLSVKF